MVRVTALRKKAKPMPGKLAPRNWPRYHVP